MKVYSILTKTFGYILGLVNEEELLSESKSITVGFPCSITELDDKRYEVSELIPWCNTDVIDLKRDTLIFASNELKSNFLNIYTSLYQDHYGHGTLH